MNFCFFIFTAILLMTEFEKGNAFEMCTTDATLVFPNFKSSFETVMKLTINEEKNFSHEERVKDVLLNNLDSVCPRDELLKNVCKLAWKWCQENDVEVETIEAAINMNNNNNENVDQEVKFDNNDENLDKYIQNLMAVGCTITLSTLDKFNFYITFFEVINSDNFIMYYFKRHDNQLKFENVQLYAYRILLKEDIDIINTCNNHTTDDDDDDDDDDDNLYL